MKFNDRIRKYILAALSGIMIVLSFPEINFSCLSWLALVPLLVSIRDVDWKESFRLGLVTGFIYFGGIMNWIMVLTPYSTVFWVTMGFLVLSLYLSSYVFIFAVSVNYLTRKWKFTYSGQYLAYSFIVAVLWTGLEILRGHVVTGLPWASMSHTQWANLPIIQISSITGMYGVTFVIAMINGVIASFLFDIRKLRVFLRAAIVPTGILIACLIFGWVSLREFPQGEKMKVALIPGNIRQDEKMASWGDKSEWIFDKYIQTTEQASEEKPDIIVWPETAVPQAMFPQSLELDRLTYLIKRWNAYMLLGTISYDLRSREVYNSAFLLSKKGEELDKYHKIHLVPLSEYFPLSRYLPKKIQDMVRGISDFNSGNRYTVFSAPPARIGVPICFESVFPEISREFVNKEANTICIITNDAWFIGTFAAQQHFSMAPFRAIENRVSVFRCANYGVSCIIDPYGRISKKLEPESDSKYLVGEVTLQPGGTFYTKHGDYLPWTCLAMSLFLVVQVWWREGGKLKYGGLNAIRNTLRSRKSKEQSRGSKRSSLTSPTKKKRSKSSKRK